MSPRIYIVGEAWGEQEERAKAPFVGPSGHVLDSLLRPHGLSRSDCIIDNVFNERPPNNDIEHYFTKEEKYAAANFPPYKPKTWLRKGNESHLNSLYERIATARPNLVLALGNTPLWALAQVSGIMKFRGSPMPSILPGVKVMATYHPAAILRQWELKPVAYMDFEKAKNESLFPEYRRPERHLLIRPTLPEIKDFYHYHALEAPYLAADIETKGLEITEIGFATSPEVGIVIPFFSRSEPDGNYWRTLAEELEAWAWVRKFLELPTVWQNGSYDLKYLWVRAGLPVPNMHGDSMLLAHSIEPEMKKGLGFLGSIYTNEPPWKLMRQEHDAVQKKGDM